MSNEIYIVVHTHAEYSDYTERVIGVATTRAKAMDFADTEANITNHIEDYYWYADRIEIRVYPVNEFHRGVSKAKRCIDYDDSPRNSYLVYEDEEVCLEPAPAAVAKTVTRFCQHNKEVVAFLAGAGE